MKELSDYEKLLLETASLDLDLHYLKSSVRSLLATKRKATGAQSLVLTEKLDELEKMVAKEART